MNEQHPILPFRRLDPAELIGANTFYRIDPGQIIFYFPQWQCFVITTIDEQAIYNEASYNLLPESAPFQLINGKLIFMAAPRINHQKISKKLYFEIESHLRQNPIGDAYYAPVDVRFDEKNIIQPDLLFVSIARKNIVGELNITGAPDFVVEILSPSNSKAEMLEKMELYGKYDVVEYWIVKPKEESVEVYHNQAQKMELFAEMGIEDTIKSVAIEGFELEVRKIFE